jgi:hypothetical protein
VPIRTIRTVGLWVGLWLFSVPAWAQFSPCDLNQDGTINTADVHLAINMTLGSVPCTANFFGAGICNVAVVQRVINAAMGQVCNTSVGVVPHYVLLNWTASTSTDTAGYNVYRGSASGGPYTKITASVVVAGTSFTDGTVGAGQTYYYVCTTVDTNNNESAYSNEATATVSSP